MKWHRADISSYRSEARMQGEVFSTYMSSWERCRSKEVCTFPDKITEVCVTDALACLAQGQEWLDTLLNKARIKHREQTVVPSNKPWTYLKNQYPHIGTRRNFQRTHRAVPRFRVEARQNRCTPSKCKGRNGQETNKNKKYSVNHVNIETIPNKNCTQSQIYQHLVP